MSSLAGPAILVLMAVIFLYTPVASPNKLLYGVTVDPGFASSAQARDIVRGYRRRIVMYTALAVVLALALDPKLMFAVLLLQCAGAARAYTVARRQLLPHASASSRLRSASLVTYREQMPLGWIGGALPLVAIAATGAYLIQVLDRLPGKLPIHWGLDGPDRFIETTPASILAYTALGLILAGGMLVSITGVVHARRIAHGGEAAVLETRFRRLTAWALLVAEYMMALMFAGLPLSAIHGSARIVTQAAIVLTAVMIVLVVWSIRVKIQQSAMPDAPIGDQTPDECWRLGGHFYYNPEDPAIFVEKRFGVGYTLNFAAWQSWAFLIVFAAAPLVFAILLR